jgi:hypothetical protein
MRYAIGLMLLVVVGCGKSPSYVQPEVQEYVSRFEQAAASEGVHVDSSALIITLQDTGFSNNEQGICYFDRVTVTLNKKFWATAMDADKELLVFHELGHCLLGRQHIKAQSIMQASLPMTSMFMDYKASYVHELFHP